MARRVLRVWLGVMAWLLVGSTAWAVPEQGHIWRHDDIVKAVAFSPDGRWVLTGSKDKTAVLRDVETGATLHTWRHKDFVGDVAFSPDGRRVLTGSADKTVVLRDAETGATLHTWRHEHFVHAVAFSPDGRRVLTGSDDKTAVLRDAESGATLHTWRHKDFVGDVAFSPDGRRVLTGSWDKTAVLRDAVTGATLHTWRHDGFVDAVVFSPDGRRVLTGSYDNTAVLRDAESGVTLHTWRHDGYVNTIAFSPDGRRVLTGSGDKTAVLRDAVTGATLHTWRHDEGVDAVVFSPDGRRVLTGSEDKTAVLRDTETGQVLHTWRHDDGVRAVAFSPDGSRVLTGSWDKTAVLRNLPASLLATTATAVAAPAAVAPKIFTPPVAATPKAVAPPVAPPRTADDPELARLEHDLAEKKRAKAAEAALAVKKAQLRQELAELDKAAPERFDEDLATALKAATRAKSNRHLHVLAVGIQDYADVADVPYADRSAERFAEMAQKLLGAQEENVVLLTDAKATSGHLRRQVKNMLNRLSPADRLIVYYAGHGVPATDGKSAYLLPQDGGAGGYEEDDLRLDMLYAQIDKSRVGQASVFIDACFSGRSDKDSMVFPGVAPIVLVPRHGVRPVGRLTVLTAGRSDQFANQDKAHGHRLFGYHLMKALLEGGSQQTAAQLHSKVRERVVQDSRRIGPEFEQEPELLGNAKAVVGR